MRSSDLRNQHHVKNLLTASGEVPGVWEVGGVVQRVQYVAREVLVDGTEGQVMEPMFQDWTKQDRADWMARFPDFYKLGKQPMMGVSCPNCHHPIPPDGGDRFEQADYWDDAWAGVNPCRCQPREFEWTSEFGKEGIRAGERVD